MKFLTRTVAIMLFMSMFIGIQSHAQEESQWTYGNSIGVTYPLYDSYDSGLGIYGNVDYNFSNFLAARFDLGWNTFDDLSPDGGRFNVWEFTGGLRAKIAVFYVEVRGGYFTRINEWAAVPAVGLRFGRLDFQFNLMANGNTAWAGARVGYYWGAK